MQREIEDRKIAVVGIGGVGGYLAAMLTRTYSHVTMVARGKRGESIKKDGLTLHSDFNGEMVVRPEAVVQSAAQLDRQDVIFICVKNYSLDEACESIKGAVAEDTVVVPVMNGVDTAQRARKILGKGIVIDSVIYIIAFANPDYSITQQGGFASLRIGDGAGGGEGGLTLLSSVLSGAGIVHKVSRDIELDIWRKYILNCAYNVATAFYDNTIGQLRADPVKAEEYEALVNEAFLLAKSKGVRVLDKHAQGIIHSFRYEVADNATSSLQRDIRAGKPSEVETFSGYVVREGRKLGLSLPVSERMYEGLLKKTGGK